MKNSISEQIALLEDQAMSTPGIVGIAEGLSTSGKPCIKLLSQVKKEDLVLPSALKQDNIEIEFIGNPRAQ